jgi:hypothetical protein
LTTALAGSLAVLMISGSVHSGIAKSRAGAAAQLEPLAMSAISGALAASMKKTLPAASKFSLTKASVLERSARANVRQSRGEASVPDR